MIHGNLVVPRISIQKTKNLVPRCFIHQAINVRKGISILRACIVQIREICAHPSLSVWLLNHHHIGLPGGFLTSTSTACLFSSPSLFFFYATRWASLKSSNLWDITLGCMSDMSAAVHAKRSLFNFNYWPMILTWSSMRPLPIEVVCSTDCPRPNDLVSPRGSIRSSVLVRGSKFAMPPSKAYFFVKTLKA